VEKSALGVKHVMGDRELKMISENRGGTWLPFEMAISF
jgi:hypothetical protein